MGEPTPLRLVVLADSTAFTTAAGPQLPGHPALYPNVVARLLEESLDRPVEVTSLARAGLTVREAWRWLTKDRHAQFDVLAHADAVIVGIGSFDHAPGGVPPVFDAIVPYLRPEGLRRSTRRAMHRAYPVIVKLTRGRMRRTARKEFARLYDQLLFQVRALTQGAPGVVLGPTSHASDYYGDGHPQHAEAQAGQFAIAARHGFPCVATWPFVERRLDELNDDGIHWPEGAHHEVAAAVAPLLVEQIRGDRPSPPSPMDDLDLT